IATDESPKRGNAKPAAATTLKVRGGVQQAVATESVLSGRAEAATSKVKRASAEEETPYDWGDLPLGDRAKRAGAAEKKAGTANQTDGGWNSPNASDSSSDGAATGGWKRAR